MRVADRAQFLRQVTAFSLLDETDLEELAGQLETLHFGVGQVVCRAGEPGDSLYLVYSGRARVLTSAEDGERTVGTLTRGDHFGEQALLTGGARTFTVRAAEDLVL